MIRFRSRQPRKGQDREAWEEKERETAPEPSTLGAESPSKSLETQRKLFFGGPSFLSHFRLNSFVGAQSIQQRVWPTVQIVRNTIFGAVREELLFAQRDEAHWQSLPFPSFRCPEELER